MHFLLCHYRNGMGLQLDPARYPRAGVGRDQLIAVSARGADGQPLWPLPGLRSQPARILGYSAASGLGRILAQALPDASLATAETVFTSHLAATLLAMARDGRGAAWLPRSLVAEDLASGRLIAAGAAPVDVEICLFRSPDCRNRAADALWERTSRVM